MSSFFLPKGLLWGKVEAVPGLHPEVRFSYKPAGYDVGQEIAAMPAAGRIAIAKKHLGEVFVVNEDGTEERVVVDEAQLKSGIPYGIVAAFVSHVVGWAGPSVDLMAGKSPAG